MHRRQLLKGGIPLLLAGCSRPISDQGRALVLNNTLPAQTLAQIGRQSGIRPRLLASRQHIWEQLQQGSRASVALIGGDWWDGEALRPVPETWLGTSWWHQIPERWQKLVTHGGKVWGIPWRWGVTAIGYRRDLLPFAIEAWEDLWRPELRRRLTLPDHPLEVIALGQRVVQTEDLGDRELLRRLRQLHGQVLLYTSADYLPMLRIGDSWAAVGWSEDLLQAQRVDARIEVVILPSLVWWDAWVLPQEGAGDPEAWLGALHQREVLLKAVQTSRLNTVVPLEVTAPWLIPDAILAASTLSRPLDREQRQAYWQLWQQIRLT
ncbi:MAG: extracellular solute-binding protein [Thermostichales cyanobacterium SZTDM-1c_bins_54]